MIFYCLNCNKEIIDRPSQKRKYCSTKCQMEYEYKIGKRDRFKIVKKAQDASKIKMKEHNWLNDKSTRDKLKLLMQNKEYRLNQRNTKLGIKNGMYGRCGELNPNYKGGSIRTNHNSADRGFDWNKFRKLTKERDNYICQECGIKEEDSKQPSQVHHILPYKIEKNNSLDNLITLCYKCHPANEPKYLKINKINNIEKIVKVYNITVDEDESYTANDIIVHNCRSTTVRIPVDK